MKNLIFIKGGCVFCSLSSTWDRSCDLFDIFDFETFYTIIWDGYAHVPTRQVTDTYQSIDIKK